MKCHGTLIALGVCLAFAPSLAAQEEAVQWQVKLGVHKFDTAAGFVYQVEVKSKEFRLEIQMGGGIFRNAANFDEQNVFRGFHLGDGEYVIIATGLSAANSIGDYTLTVRTTESAK